MTKAQKEARAKNIEVLARNYPAINADKLQTDLYKLSLACELNALHMRWLLVVETRVVESEDAPNFCWIDGKLVALEAPVGA